MKIPLRMSSVDRGFARTGLIAGGAMVFLLALAALSMAGDVSPQPADSLNITSSTTGVLPQPTSEAGWLSDFHVSGFVSQTFGMWENPAALKQYTLSRNSLAASRSWLQADENWRLNENNSFFFREWFIYEPPYAFNSAGNIYAGGPTHGKGSPGPNGTLCTPAGPAGCPSTPFIGGQTKVAPAISSGATRSLGHFNNDFYNQYTVRDFWWENKTGPLTTYIGNQIIVWGQSLAFRVGDLINPVDTTWIFGFSNLEQSRIPQWVVHPILNLPVVGPLTSNFLEGMLNPRYAPQWSWDYPDGR